MPAKKTSVETLSKWDSIYRLKTKETDVNKERGVIYEMLDMYGVQKYLNTPQKLKWFKYVVTWCAREIKLFLAGRQVFETDNVYSLERRSKLVRAFQNLFDINDELGLNIQLKNYMDEPVKRENLSHDISQVGLANQLGYSLYKNVARYLWKNASFLNIDEKTLGENYIEFNEPHFKELDDSLDKKLKQIKSVFESGENIIETVGNKSYEVTIKEVVDFNVIIEGKPVHTIQIKPKKEGQPNIYYMTGEDISCVVVEETKKQYLGELKLSREKAFKIFTKYCITNFVEPKEYDTVIDFIDKAINPERFIYISPSGIQGEDQIKERFNITVLNSINDLAELFKSGKVLKAAKKYNFNTSLTNAGILKLRDELENLLWPIVLDDNLRSKNLIKAVKKFIPLID